ncbi:MazG-like family protein [Streptomyces sp. NPDC048491]|uniref:MazG-like family protein n=1 Tax=Streptomyces sp. NPDC048491 TaxID=3157207 RepID=UPI00341B208A
MDDTRGTTRNSPRKSTWNSSWDSPWPTVAALHAWLTEESPVPPEQQTLLRMLKLSEEVGEVAQAVIGATGQNPRKGVSHSWQDVQSELCDVIVTAMVALTALTADAGDVFDTHLAKVAERSLGPGRRRPDTP